MWSKLFDIVKIRKVKRVSGKCWTCAYINEIRQKQKGHEVQEVIKSSLLQLLLSISTIILVLFLKVTLTKI